MATQPTPYKKYTKTIRARCTIACHTTASRNQSPRPAPPLQGYASQHSTTDDDIPPHSPTTSHRDAGRTNARHHLSRRWHTHTSLRDVNHIFKETDPWRRRRPLTKNILRQSGHGTLLRAISPPRAISHPARLHLFRATHRNIPHLTTTSHHTHQRPGTVHYCVPYHHLAQSIAPPGSTSSGLCIATLHN